MPGNARNNGVRAVSGILPQVKHMEIVFLGTGGGRFNLLSQLRRTGGFRINGALNFHVDPGPGALSGSLAFSQDPRKTDFLVVTHNHIDHVNDAGLMIEAMTTCPRGSKGPYPKAGGLIASKSVLCGDEFGERAISSYHTGKLCERHVAEPGRGIRLSARRASAFLLPAKVKHEDRTGFGFVLQMEGRRIGYTSDTEYYRGMAPAYSGCDVLIANNLKRTGGGVAPGHLDSGQTIKLLRQARPRLAVITHLGMTLIQHGPEKEAALIGRASGVRTIAAEDGMRINVRSLAASRPKRRRK